MTEPQLTMAEPSEPSAGDGAVEGFRSQLRGALLSPGMDGYDDARRVWNGMIDRRPALIARCAGPADVIHCVNFAREHGLVLSVRGGGHSAAGTAVCEGGLMIDLSLMRSVRVDPAQRTARAEGGCTWGDFDRETQAFGLATTGGVVPTTGIGGLTLGGGIGWLQNKHGLASDNLLSVDIVTADGCLRQANAEQNPDLFWGVRGGGGNFGVVTSFTFQVHPVGQVLGGTVAYPFAMARDVLRFYREFAEAAPEELGAQAGLGSLPDGTRIVAVTVCYNGAIEEGERVLRPLRMFGPPLSDQIAPMSYVQLQSMQEAAFPPGIHCYWKSNFLRALSDEAIETMIEEFQKVPSLTSVVGIEHLGGAVRRAGEDETAFDHRKAHFNLIIVGLWHDPAAKDQHIRWTRTFWNSIQPFSSGGVYVNYLGAEEDEGAERVAAAYGPVKHERLSALKKKYDPNNLFRLNQNIRPTS